MAAQLTDKLPIDRLGINHSVTVADIIALAGVASAVPGVHALDPGILSGGFFAQNINASALVTIASVANRLDFFPFLPAKNLTINEIALEVTTAVASSLVHIGIYRSDSLDQVGVLLVGTVTSLSCATVGVKSLTIANTPLIAGTLYYLAVFSNSTQTYRGVPVSACMSIGHAGSGSSAVFTCRRATGTFATGLPASGPGISMTSSILPWFRLRKA